MDFGQAVSAGFANYVNFNGRACRSEFWWWTLFSLLAMLAALVVGGTAHLGTSLYGLTALALLLPGLAVQVRRLHDTDHSGWWVLLSFVPLIGIFVLIVWWCTPGPAGPNAFGPDPLDPMTPAAPSVFGAPRTAAPAAWPASSASVSSVPPAPGSTPAPAPAGVAGDPLARLEQLGRLRDQGLLTEEEFAAEKAKLLGRAP